MNDRGPRINEQIRLSPIRVIGAEGEQLGIIPTAQALDRAREVGLDLVEVAPTERPPVCRIMDYGKYRYEQSKKAAKSAKAHQPKQKEIRVSPVTGQHDIDVKLGQARFLGSGKALGEGEPDGYAQLVMDADTQLLLGATIMGVHAVEMIHEIGVAISDGLTVPELGEIIHAHPTVSEMVMDAAQQAVGVAPYLS